MEIDAIKEAYAKGWEDACGTAIARFRPMTECSFSADEAIGELSRMIETGAHDPENQCGYDLPPLLPPDRTRDGDYEVDKGGRIFIFRWVAATQHWEGAAGSSLDIATPEGAAMMGFRLRDRGSP